MAFIRRFLLPHEVDDNAIAIYFAINSPPIEPSYSARLSVTLLIIYNAEILVTVCLNNVIQGHEAK